MTKDRIEDCDAIEIEHDCIDAVDRTLNPLGRRVASRDEPSSVEAQHRSDLSPQPAKVGAGLNAINTKRETKKAFAAKAAEEAVGLQAAGSSKNATAAEVVRLFKSPTAFGLATIDPEFQRLIPPISAEEYTQLEANIIRDGCQEPLCFWDDILIDGHNRYKICTKHSLPYKTAKLKFESREHVRAWIGERQLGRRNLSDDQRAWVLDDLRAARSQIERAAQLAKARSVKAGSVSAESADTEKPKTDTRKAVAVEAAIPERKIRLAQEIKSVPQKVEKQVEAGKLTAPEAKMIVAVANDVGDLVREGIVGLVDAKKLIAKPAALSFLKKLMAKAKAPTPVSSAVIRAAVREVNREVYNTRVAESKPKALEGKYRIIYADPPWKYIGMNQADEYGPAERHYDCLTDEELIAYKPDGKRTVKEMADNNSVLFLWVTSPLLERCFPIMRAWGFAYKSSFVWDKIEHNMGHYNSVRHEFLLIATKGSCTPDIKKLHDSVVSIKRTEHSRKPKEFRDLIEKMYDHGRKLQLFSRKVVPGWDVVGNEI